MFSAVPMARHVAICLVSADGSPGNAVSNFGGTPAAGGQRGFPTDSRSACLNTDKRSLPKTSLGRSIPEAAAGVRRGLDPVAFLWDHGSKEATHG